MGHRGARRDGAGGSVSRPPAPYGCSGPEGLGPRTRGGRSRRHPVVYKRATARAAGNPATDSARGRADIRAQPRTDRLRPEPDLRVTEIIVATGGQEAVR